MLPHLIKSSCGINVLGLTWTITADGGMEADANLLFWEKQYRSELAEPFDWFFGYEDFPREWWEAQLGPPSSRVLVSSAPRKQRVEFIL